VAGGEQPGYLERRDRAHVVHMPRSEQQPGGSPAEAVGALLRPDPYVGVEEEVQRSISQSRVVSIRTRSRRMTMRPLSAPKRLPPGRFDTGCTAANGFPRRVIMTGCRVRCTSFSVAMHLALNSDTSMVRMASTLT